MAKRGRICVIGNRGSLTVDPRRLMGTDSTIIGIMLYGATYICSLTLSPASPVNLVELTNNCRLVCERVDQLNSPRFMRRFNRV